MQLPPLTPEERAGLVEAIRRDGIKYPVLLDPTGDVIDGNNRREIAAELDIECPTVVLDVDPQTAARLKISLNVNRRQLAPNYRRELVHQLRQLDMTMGEIAAAVGISDSTVARDLSVIPHGITEKATVRGRDGKRYPASKLNSKARKQEIAERQAARRATERSVKKTTDERLTAAAANAPAGSLNLPALRKGRELRAGLIALARLVPPDRFVSQLPLEACREFTEDVVSWWQIVAVLAADRLSVEGRDLPPLPESQRV